MTRESYRLFNCARCHRLRVICSFCDRGNIYCSADCSKAARSACLRRYGKDYQATEEGKRNHAARQQNYLGRKDDASWFPGPCGCPTLPSSAEIELGGEEKHESAEAPPPPPPATNEDEAARRCDFCHEACRPFGRRHFLRTPVRNRHIGPSHRIRPLRP